MADPSAPKASQGELATDKGRDKLGLFDRKLHCLDSGDSSESTILNPLQDEASIKAAREKLHQSRSKPGYLDQKLHCLDSDGRPVYKNKDDSPLQIFCAWIVENQIGISVNLLLLLAMTHLAFPRARTYTRRFFELSYHNPETNLYPQGANDYWFISFWIVALTGLRAFVMDYILTPLAKKGGVKTDRDRVRFAEQAWLLVFYGVFWPLGMYLLTHSDYWLNLPQMWTEWPTREIPGLRKWYILVQYAFWVQQLLVIHIEKKRKDHWQMFSHHIITIMLISTSYAYHTTKMANLILCIMDVVDIFLPVGKCMKYLGFTTICDIFFGIFMLAWVIARHIFYMIAVWSLYKDGAEQINFGCYNGGAGDITGPFPSPSGFGYLLEPFRNPRGQVCWDNTVYWYFISALLFLQGLTIMWFMMICKVALGVLRGKQADDVRSDDEDEEELSNEKLPETNEPIELPPLEEEVGVEAINFKGRTYNASRYKKGSSSSTGVSLSSDRKELLGRIGCDKTT